MLQIKAALRDGLWKTLAIPENILDRTVLSLEKHPVTSLLIVFLNRIVNEWNGLSNHIRESNSITAFKKNVLSFIKDN